MSSFFLAHAVAGTPASATRLTGGRFALPRGGGGEALTIRFGVDLGSGKDSETDQGAQINLHLGGLTVGPELVALLLFNLFPGRGARTDFAKPSSSGILTDFLESPHPNFVPADLSLIAAVVLLLLRRSSNGWRPAALSSFLSLLCHELSQEVSSSGSHLQLLSQPQLR